MRNAVRVRLSAALAACFIAAWAGASAAADDLKPGEILDATNWQKAEGLLPPEILKHYQNGDYANPIVDWPVGKYEVPPDFRAGSEKNAGQLDIDPTGTIVEKGSGKQPTYVIGYPFPVIDPADPKAGTKVVWNFFPRQVTAGVWNPSEDWAKIAPHPGLPPFAEACPDLLSAKVLAWRANFTVVMPAIISRNPWLSGNPAAPPGCPLEDCGHDGIQIRGLGCGHRPALGAHRGRNPCAQGESRFGCNCSAIQCCAQLVHCREQARHFNRRIPWLAAELAVGTLDVEDQALRLRPVGVRAEVDRLRRL